ncbi:hypothetical protein Gocc_0293 [Gaiella occulta]|uniref:Uncharacterized protein n=1 Tax=Gaiella occulta TaxID=1002870 RepID=A0A7M2Z208_9ACTN|nr:hypothetical protein [Gaiella occulta]RDI75874.1 hypothetical protein Gocc_0293 [Gaiella occulta]
MNVTPLARTLDHELVALVRGVSLECPVCGEFVMHLPAGGIFCPECGSGLCVEATAEPAPRTITGTASASGDR